MKPVTVIFQVTAIGENLHALSETVGSVLHWAQHSPAVCYRPLVWLIVEPQGYASDPGLYESWRRDGAEVWVVPKGYRTPLGTSGKARALQYACDLRTRLGKSGPAVWVYHQDEETCVGQDTVLGISEFIRREEKLVGAGIILYPLDWSPIPTHVQELTRSYDDLRVLDSLTLPGNPTAGFHGSHFLVRADVEDSIGWDVSGYSPAEDLTFEIRLRARYGPVFGVLQGFAYEKGAFSVRDQLRQRRRWVRGILYAIRRSPVLSRRRKVSISYSAISWYSALPSMVVLVASVFLHYGPLLLVTSLFSGFVWISMVTGYTEGARLHRQYVGRAPGLLKLFYLGVMGAVIDVIAPWYALFTGTYITDFIRKDPLALGSARRVTSRTGPVLTERPGARRFPSGLRPLSEAARARGRRQPKGFARVVAAVRRAAFGRVTRPPREPSFAVAHTEDSSEWYPGRPDCLGCGRPLTQGESLFYTFSAADAIQPTCRRCLATNEWVRYRPSQGAVVCE